MTISAENSKMTEVEIYTDGACSGNPGAGAVDRGGDGHQRPGLHRIHHRELGGGERRPGRGDPLPLLGGGSIRQQSGCGLLAGKSDH